jgi:hypothetical protein
MLQYLVFEYVEKTLLEVLEARRGGLGAEEVSGGQHQVATTRSALPAVVQEQQLFKHMPFCVFAQGTGTPCSFE